MASDDEACHPLKDKAKGNAQVLVSSVPSAVLLIAQWNRGKGTHVKGIDKSASGISES
jgi:hypothetical protein